MQRHRLLFLAGLLLTEICGLSGARALSTSGPTITATGLTMPSSGNGSSQFTMTGSPGNGTVIIGCGALSKALTPGTHQYTIVATYQDTAVPILGAILRANIEVAVQ
jgi:hypothetical protein